MGKQSIKKNQEDFPHLGFGLGLRIPHYRYIFEHLPKVDWFEIISENFMDTDGRPRRNLARIREHYPIVMHGIAMSIGSMDPLDDEYLTKLKALIDDIEPAWVSDHLCWTGIAHRNTHDLLPVPYTREALDHIVTRINKVQERLKRTIALENPSTYLEFKTSEMGEAEFIAEMVKQSGCKLLLDVNNVYVSSYNHRLDPKSYIDTLPLDQVVQIHLSGHTNNGTHIVDTHDDHVIDEVWALYKYVTHKAGRTFNTMIEWDDKIPEFEILFAELGKAKQAVKDAQNYAPLPQLAQAQERYVANQPTPLPDAQTRMQDAILQGERFDSAPREWIRDKIDFPPTAQLGVYINAYRFRLYDVTAEDYPILKHYLGTEKFEQLITNFIEASPSTHFNVGRYAAQLPDFVKSEFNKDVFAQELVEFETAISQLTDPQETIPLAPEHLNGLTPESLLAMVLHPRAALQLFHFQYPVNAYYQAVKDESAPKKPKKVESFVAVFRHEDVVWRMDLGANEYRLLEKLFTGMAVGDALAALEKELNISEEALSAELAHWFGRWMRNGLLAAA